MAITTGNILIGPAKSFTVDGIDRGATQGGVTVDLAYTTKDIEADQVVGPIDQAMTGRVFTAKTMLLEASLANLATVWGLAAPIVNGGGQNELDIDVVRFQPEHNLIIVGRGVGGLERTVTFHRAKVKSSQPWEFSKDKEEIYEVEFLILPDFSQVGTDKFGSIIDGPGVY